MNGPIFVTDHAVLRLLARVAPGFDDRGARAFLRAAWETAAKTRDLRDGVSEWRADSCHGRIRLRAGPPEPGAAYTCPRLQTVLAATDDLDVEVGRRAAQRMRHGRDEAA